MEKLYHYRSPTDIRQLNQYLTKRFPAFNFCYTILRKEPRFRLRYLYTGLLSGKLYPILDQTCLISIPYPRRNCLKTTPLTAAHTHIAYMLEYPSQVTVSVNS